MGGESSLCSQRTRRVRKPQAKETVCNNNNNSSPVDVGYKNTLGVGKYVLVTSINYTVDMRTVFQKIVLISGMFLYHVFL